MNHLFAYGTLCVPEVMRALLGFELHGEPATLRDYRRRLITDCVFPGVTAEPGSECTGTLFRNLDEETMRILDAYEASFYERRTVMVSPAGVHSDGQTLAEVYVLPESEAWRLSDEPWDQAAFVRDHLSSYLNW